MGLAGEIVERIKQLLRTRGITYRNLAEHLGVSESALKRSFAKQEFSLSRLGSICAFLDISLADLAKAGERHHKVDFLSPEQELALAADEGLLVVFYLALAGLDVEVMNRKTTFTSQQVEKSLLALDKLGLIKLESGNRFQSLVKQSVWWDPRGPLSQKYYPIIKPDFISSLFDGEHEGLWFVSGRVSEASLKTFHKKLSKVAAELHELIDLDEALPPEALINCTFFAGYRPWVLPFLGKYLKRPQQKDNV